MHAVIETAAYLAASDNAGMDDEERTAVVDLIASNPMAGDIMPGCGGARKLRNEQDCREKCAGNLHEESELFPSGGQHRCGRRLR